MSVLAFYWWQGPRGFNANAVAFGTVHSPQIWGERLRQDPEILDKIGRRIPRRTVGRAEKAAAVLCWLASSDAALVNGQVLQADGGWTASAGTSVAAPPGEEHRRKWFES